VVLDSALVQEYVLVAWTDTKVGGVADTLDLSASGVAEDEYGLSGTMRSLPAAAVSLVSGPDGRITLLDKATGILSLDTAAATVGNYLFADSDFSVTYDSNDTFSIGGIPASFTEFVAAISRGDGVTTGTYSTTPAAVSTFELTDGATLPTHVATPTNLSVAVVVTPALPALVALYDSFIIERAPVVSGVIGTYATVATVTTALDEDAVLGTVTYTDTVPAAGSYSYRTAGVIDGDTGAKSTAATIVTTAAAADVTAPTTSFHSVITDALFQSTADVGDVIRLLYSEPVTLTSNATLRIQETVGFPETFDIVRGTNATFATNSATVVQGASTFAAGRVLTVTLTAKPAPLSVVASGNNELRIADVPQIQNALGIADAATNLYAPTATVLARDVALPTISAQVGGEGAATLTLTYDRFAYFVDNAATRAQFVYKGATPTAISGSGSATVVLTFAAGVVLNADDASTLTYTESATTTARIQALNSKTAPSPATTAAIVVGV